MDNEGLKNSVIKFISKNNELSPEYLKDLKEKVSTLRNLRVNIDNILETLKISIIKSSSHLLIDKIHKGDVESSLKIIENTRDRTVFYDFISIMDEMMVLNEQYIQKYEVECGDLKDIKEYLGLNDHKLFRVIDEIDLDN
jgi:hypothetical protein